MNNYDAVVFDAMQVDAPLAIYQKTIVGQVYVTILNPFNNQPEGHLLTGKPGEESSQFKVWSVPGDVFFKQMNRRHFETGTIIKVSVKTPEVEKPTLEQASDEELHALINGKFLALQNELRKTESEALVFRLLSMAENEEKSAKLINAIKTRLAEIQEVKFNRDQIE